ncbi:MAG TPA: hypothetical protein VFQ68_08120 [Streptosporangiaceae bacterium]|nr:hypothetical protein [Streptosporangiaceae bacterium]
MMMTPGDLVTGGTLSLEVRWILPGSPDAAVTEWFAGFPSEVESREDAYFLDPDMDRLSVKVRAGRLLEVKAFGGSPGILESGGRGRGHMQYWRKWSVPFRPPSSGSCDPDGWQRVRKQRRTIRFSLTRGWITEPAGNRDGEPRCAVELTGIRVHYQDWWSLGLEATGPADLLSPVLGAAAALVFTQPLPPGLDLGVQDSTSYAEWLRRPRCRP